MMSNDNNAKREREKQELESLFPLGTYPVVIRLPFTDDYKKRRHYRCLDCQADISYLYLLNRFANPTTRFGVKIVIINTRHIPLTLTDNH